MNGPEVLLAVFIIAGLFTLAWWLLDTDFEARREQDRRDRAFAREQRRRDLASRGPRVFR